MMDMRSEIAYAALHTNVACIYKMKKNVMNVCTYKDALFQACTFIS